MQQRFYLAKQPGPDISSSVANIVNLSVIIVPLDKNGKEPREISPATGCYRGILSGRVLSIVFSIDNSKGMLWFEGGILLEWDESKLSSLVKHLPAPKELSVDELILQVEEQRRNSKQKLYKLYYT